MRDTPERDLAVAHELGRMADARIRELESEVAQLREVLLAMKQRAEVALSTPGMIRGRDQLQNAVEVAACALALKEDERGNK